MVQIPDAETVICGDIAYNDIHMWLVGSTPESRGQWLASLDSLAALNATTMIAGHRDPDAPDDSARRILDQSRRYLEHFNLAIASSASPAQIIDKMLSTYAHFGNPYTLWLSAAAQFSHD